MYVRPSLFYSFSFAPLYTSKSLYLTGPEFVKYLNGAAARYQVTDKTQLNTDIIDLRYLDTEEEWEVTISYLAPGPGDLSESQRREIVARLGRQSVYLKQEKVQAKILVSCVGILVEPNAWPTSIPRRKIFRVAIFHSAGWRDDIDFGEKDVVVVGTGFSAAPIVPPFSRNLTT